MGRLHEDRFSSQYAVRRLTDGDIPLIVDLCTENAQYYAYCAKETSAELIRQDLRLLPPGKCVEDKYYVGFFAKETLVAVLDLIDGYPAQTTAYLGFFMMNKEYQGKGVGTSIIQELCAYLKGEQFTSVQLGIDKENPQSNHFWKKNGFAALREVPQEDGVIILAEKAL